MAYRDPNREAIVQEEKQKKLENKKNTVEEFRRSTFNILSHEGPPRKYDQLLKIRNEEYENNKNSKRSYNLLTNLPHTSHLKTSLYYNEDYILKEHADLYKNSRLAKHNEHLKTLGKEREFNIISNDFYDNPEERKSQDYAQLKKHVLKKFWETHDYDPVKGVYYSPEKEELYQQQKQILNEVYGKSKELTIPPSIQYAESSAYNIINHDVKDDFKLTIATTSDQRSINRKNRLTKELKMIEKGEEKKSNDDERHMKRISFKRWETEIDRGYNAIKNEVVKNPPNPIPTRPATMWERLTTDTLSNQNNVRDGQNGKFVNQFPSRGVTAGVNSTTNSGRVRNLAGTSSVNDEPSQTKNYGGGEKTYAQSARSEILSQWTDRSGNASTVIKKPNSGSIPKLDLTKAETGESVFYQEPPKGPPGLSVPIVRTGGNLSQY